MEKLIPLHIEVKIITTKIMITYFSLSNLPVSIAGTS